VNNLRMRVVNDGPAGSFDAVTPFFLFTVEEKVLIKETDAVQDLAADKKEATGSYIHGRWRMEDSSPVPGTEIQ